MPPGAAGLVDSEVTGTVSTTPLTLSSAGAISSGFQCAPGYDRTWFRLDTEDSQNLDRSIGPGEPPEGMTTQGGKFPTLIMCRPTGVTDCAATGADIWRKPEVQAAWGGVSAAQVTNVWDGGSASSCTQLNGTALGGWVAGASSRSACETEPSGSRWGVVTATPPPPPPSNSSNDTANATNVTATVLGFGCFDAGGGLTSSVSAVDTTPLAEGCEIQRSHTWRVAVAASCTNAATGDAVAALNERECEGQNGRKKLFVEVICPASCAAKKGWAGRLFGADVYAADTPVCVAGVHGNVLGDVRGGRLLVWLDAPDAIAAGDRQTLRGAFRQGIRTFGADRPMASAMVNSMANGSGLVSAAITFTVATAGTLGPSLTNSTAVAAAANPAVAALLPSIAQAAAAAAALAPTAETSGGLGPGKVPVTMGYLSLPAPPDYRPDWARLTDVLFFSPALDLNENSTLAGAGDWESIWAAVAVAAGAAAHTAELVAEAQRAGVKCHLVLRCYDAAVFKSVVGTASARASLVAAVVDAFATSSVLTGPGELPPTIHWDGLQLDIQQFHSQETVAYVALVREIRHALSAGHSVRSGPPLQLTATLPPEESEASKFAVLNMAPHLDYFVLHGHQLGGESPFRQPFAVPPAPLHTAALPGGKSLAQVVAAYLAPVRHIPCSRAGRGNPSVDRVALTPAGFGVLQGIGVLAHQLVLTLPWYGLEWTLRAVTTARKPKYDIP